MRILFFVFALSQQEKGGEKGRSNKYNLMILPKRQNQRLKKNLIYFSTFEKKKFFPQKKFFCLKFLKAKSLK